MAPNGTNPSLYKSNFSTFWLSVSKCAEIGFEKVLYLVPFGANVTHFGAKPDTPAFLKENKANLLHSLQCILQCCDLLFPVFSLLYSFLAYHIHLVLEGFHLTLKGVIFFFEIY